MVMFHTMFDLRYFGVGDPVGLKKWPAALFDHYSTCIAASFLTLVGVSARLRSRSTNPQSLRLTLFLKPLLRVLLSALIVTIASIVAHTSLPIYFGVLHLIAFSMLIMPLTLRAPRVFGALGLALIVIGFSHPHLHGVAYEWIGLAHNPYKMGDYFPFFPWLGFVWVGSALADLGLKSTRTLRWPASWEPRRWARSLCFGGRHTLIIYLVHQPLIIGLLWLVGLVRW
jgi:uncharacterized membrane protein